jgi:hypothetical protein
MLRQYQMLSNGSGAVAAGQVLLCEASAVQSKSRDYSVTVGMAGTTAQRPKQGDADFPLPVQGGITYLDTTLGFVIVSDGNARWRNPLTGALV